MHTRRWLIAFAVPAAVFAASFVYWSRQPPCASFIDGPCGNPEALFGFWWFAQLLSAVAMAALAFAWVLALGRRFVRRRRRRLPAS